MIRLSIITFKTIFSMKIYCYLYILKGYHASSNRNCIARYLSNHIDKYTQYTRTQKTFNQRLPSCHNVCVVVKH